MKKTIVYLISLLLLNCSVINSKVPASDTLRLVSTSGLFSLATTWADEYSALNSGLKVKVILATNTREAEEFINRGMLGFVTADNYPGPISKNGWNTIVARDVIAPVINSSNPALDNICKYGISSELFVKIMNNKGGENWNNIIQGAANGPVHYYWTKDETVTNRLSEFLNTVSINQAGTEFADNESMITALQKDPYAIGFCKLTSVIDTKNQVLAGNLKLLPIDRNGNGMIDYSESIYNDFSQLSRGIWIGKYPKQLYSNIYATGINAPEGEASLAFIKWVLTDGQRFLFESGYIDLLLTERQKSVDQLYKAKVYVAPASETRSPFVLLLIILGAIIAVAAAADFIIRYARQAGSITAIPVQNNGRTFGESAVEIPQGLYFDKAHTWAFMEQDGMVKVGIDDFLQHITGAITRVKLKENGSEVRKGEQILSLIQNGKHLDIYAPVSGTIRESNSALEANSGLINSSPYNLGWIYKIEPSNWQRENQLLFFAGKYRQYLGQEFIRLKDFFATVLNEGNEKYSKVILQDGGEICDGVLSQMGPEIWDDFQTKYIDPSKQIWFYELF